MQRHQQLPWKDWKYSFKHRIFTTKTWVRHAAFNIVKISVRTCCCLNVYCYLSAPKWKHDFFRHLFNILAVLLGVLRALRTIYHLEGLLGYYRGKTFRSLLFCFGELLIDNKASFLGQALFMKELNLISKNKYMYACLKFLSIYWFYFWGKYSLIQGIVFLYTCVLYIVSNLFRKWCSHVESLSLWCFTVCFLRTVQKGN